MPNLYAAQGITAQDKKGSRHKSDLSNKAFQQKDGWKCQSCKNREYTKYNGRKYCKQCGKSNG